LHGNYTMQGELFDTVAVVFGRSAGNNIIQATGRKWSEQYRATFDPTYALAMYCDQSSGLINIAVMDGKVWRLLNGFKLFREKLDTRRGSNSQLETAVKDLGAVVS
ncbi:major capsid protein, partial [Salmonella enterica]|uniref:major capsid protein n=1 Tax=Salmonella enterica TaxID=28901 RepID=UPI000C10E7AB